MFKQRGKICGQPRTPGGTPGGAPGGSLENKPGTDAGVSDSYTQSV